MLLNGDKAHRVFNRLIKMDNLKYHTPDGWDKYGAMLSDCVILHNIVSRPLNIQVIHCDNNIRAFIVQMDFIIDGVPIRENNRFVLNREFYYKDGLVTANLSRLYSDYIKQYINDMYRF